MDLVGVRDTIERYAHAVQEADVEALRSLTCGTLREQLSPEKARLIAAHLAADTCQHGSISVSDLRDPYFDADQWKITARLNFEHAPPLTVRFTVTELHGRWQIVGTHTMPGDTTRSVTPIYAVSAVPMQPTRTVDHEEVA